MTLSANYVGEPSQRTCGSDAVCSAVGWVGGYAYSVVDSVEAFCPLSYRLSVCLYVLLPMTTSKQSDSCECHARWWTQNEGVQIVTNYDPLS